jgi:phosphoribosylamine---glycine ligase
MHVLVLGSGGREHALAWKLSRESAVSRVTCAPGNPGMAECATLVTVDPLDPPAVLAWARAHAVDLTVVGPEQPLAIGIVDAFTEGAAAIVGPTRLAARLETSKAFAKQFMARHSVPTAGHRVCTTPEQAYDALEALGGAAVVKADGLAAGKGVTVADDLASARAAVDAAMKGDAFGDAGRTIVIEERLAGPEVSVFVLCDGVHGITLATAQDHKRAFDGDQGPNTGGMGAFAPSPLVDAALQRRIDETIVAPVLRGMADEGYPFRGFLYCGLMLTTSGPKVIEFNVRFGDPEAQVVMPLLRGDLAPALRAAATGDLGSLDARALKALRLRATTDRGDAATPVVCVGVVLASGGYPGAVTNGRVITGVDHANAMEDVQVFHAGTARRDGALVTKGGRVLTVTAVGATYAAARARAYDGVARIEFEGMQFRRDIGASVR